MPGPPVTPVPKTSTTYNNETLRQTFGGTPTAGVDAATREHPGLLPPFSQNTSLDRPNVAVSEYGVRCTLEDIKDQIFVKTRNLSGNNYPSTYYNELSGVVGFIEHVDRGTKQIYTRSLDVSNDIYSEERVGLYALSGADPTLEQSVIINYNGRGIEDWYRRVRSDTQLDGGRIEKSSHFKAETAWELRHGRQIGLDLVGDDASFRTDTGDVALYYANGISNENSNITIYTGSANPCTSGTSIAISKLAVRITNYDLWDFAGQKLYVVALDQATNTILEVLGSFETQDSSYLASVSGENIAVTYQGNLSTYGYFWSDKSITLAVSATDLKVCRQTGNNLNALDPQGDFYGGFELRAWYDEMKIGSSETLPVSSLYSLPTSKQWLNGSIPLEISVFPPYAGYIVSPSGTATVLPFRSTPVEVYTDYRYVLSAWVHDAPPGCADWEVDNITDISTFSGNFVESPLSADTFYHYQCSPSASLTAVMASGLRRYWRTKAGGLIGAPTGRLDHTVNLTYTHPVYGQTVSKPYGPYEYMTSGWYSGTDHSERNRLMYYNWVLSGGTCAPTASMVPLTAMPLCGYQWCGFWEVEDLSGYRQGYDELDFTEVPDGIRPPELYQREDWDGRLSGVGSPVHWRQGWDSTYSTFMGPCATFCIQPFDLSSYTSVSTWFVYVPEITGKCDRDKGFLFGGAGQREVGYWNGQELTRYSDIPAKGPNPWKKNKQQPILCLNTPNVGWTGSDFWLAGGFCGDSSYHNTFLFEPSTNSWAVGQMLPGGKAGDVVKGANATLYYFEEAIEKCHYYPFIVGGWMEDGIVRNAVYFDKATESIIFMKQFLPDHPIVRTRGAELSGNMYMLGGNPFHYWGNKIKRMSVIPTNVVNSSAPAIKYDSFDYTVSTGGDMNYTMDGYSCGAMSKGVKYDFGYYNSSSIPVTGYPGIEGLLSGNMDHLKAAWKFEIGNTTKDSIGQNNLVFKGKKTKTSDNPTEFQNGPPGSEDIDNYVNGEIWNATLSAVYGDLVRPTGSALSGYYFNCISGGVVGGTEPVTWPLTAGSTVTDGSVIWQYADNVTKQCVSLSGHENFYTFDDPSLNPRQGIIISWWMNINSRAGTELNKREEQQILFKGQSSSNFAYSVSLSYDKNSTLPQVKYSVKTKREDKKSQKTYTIVTKNATITANTWTHVVVAMVPRNQFVDNEQYAYGYMGIFINGVLQSLIDNSGKNSKVGTKCAYGTSPIQTDTIALFDLYDFTKTTYSGTTPGENPFGDSVDYLINDEKGKLYIGSQINSRRFKGKLDEIYIWGDNTFNDCGTRDEFGLNDDQYFSGDVSGFVMSIYHPPEAGTGNGSYLFETSTANLDPSLYSFCCKGSKTGSNLLPRNRYLAVKVTDDTGTNWITSAYDVPSNCRHLIDGAKGGNRPTCAYVDENIVIVGHQWDNNHNIVTTIRCVDDNGNIIPEIDRVFTTTEVTSDFRQNINGKYNKANYLTFG